MVRKRARARERERRACRTHCSLSPGFEMRRGGERGGQDFGWHKLSSKDKELCKLVRCKEIIRSGTR